MFIGYSGTTGWKYGGWAVLVGIGNAILGGLVAWLVLAKRTKNMTRRLVAKTMPDFFEKRYDSKKLKVIASFIVCPKMAHRMFTKCGEARGGDFALNDIPHPCRGLYLGAKVEN